MTKCDNSIQQHRWSVLLLLLMAGCSSTPGRPACYPVKGTVQFQQQPLEEAQVTLHPVSGTITPLPTGITNRDGTFSITTWAANDGAPAGDYKVTVVWKQLVQQGEEKIRNGKNLLPAIYADPLRTPLKCSITTDANPPLQLTIKP